MLEIVEERGAFTGDLHCSSAPVNLPSPLNAAGNYPWRTLTVKAGQIEPTRSPFRRDCRGITEPV